MFYAIFGIANGPLAFSIMLYKLPLVIHSDEKTASLFVHLVPLAVTWTMRWHYT